MPKGNILLSAARSGTNYFLTVYSKCFPRDFVAKEIFRPTGDSLSLIKELTSLSKDEVLSLIASDPLKLWTTIVDQAAAEERNALAKIFYYHVDTENPLWAHFRDNDRVIHLIRRNAFDAFVSHKVATQTGKWQEFGKDKQPSEVSPLILDRDEVSHFIESRKVQVENARTFFNNSDYSEIFYEDIATSVKACTQKICDIFEVKAPSKGVAISLRKQKSKRNIELISNYDEVAEFDKDIF